MKALTICQPYSELICLPDDDPRAKRVENRTWATSYRGPLLIHAGKTKQWLNGNDYGLDTESLAFGALIGLAKLADCVRVDLSRTGGDRIKQSDLARWPWLATHRHVEGPYCFVLTECRRFAEPYPFRGSQGFFHVPDEVIASALEAPR